MSKNTLRINLVLIALIAVGLLAGLVSFLHRYSAEARNRRVELVIDYSDAQQLANTTSRSMPDVLAQLRQAGITTVAITEDTLATLNTNYITTVARDGGDTVLTFARGIPDERARIVEMLAHKAPGLRVTPEGARSLRVSAPWAQFDTVPIGLDEQAVQYVRDAGLLVAPRLVNFTGVTPDNIAWTLAQTRAQCTPAALGPVIFAGSDVLGNRSQIRATADALAALDMTYGSVEFAKTFGDDDLSRLAAARTVRVHSIGRDEIGAMDEPTAVERFVRGARERNIRVCYVRLFLNGLKPEAASGPNDVLADNVRFVTDVVKGLHEARTSFAGPLILGGAHPYRMDPTPSRPLRLLMAVGVMAGAVLLLRVFTGLDGRVFWGALAFALLLGLALAWPGHGAKGRELLALLAACVFPTLGLCYQTLTPAPRGRPAPGSGVLGRAFGAYARITLATVAGIVFVVGLLAGRLFLIKVDEFFGVKLVLVTPVLLTLAYYGLGLAELGPGAGWAARRDSALRTVQTLTSQPLLVGQLVLGLIALVALALFVARSGNDPGVGVSQTELHVRALLDKYLLVRPRTKEFLLGHPALFFALAAAFSGRFRKWVLPLLVVGAIGQSSLMDTFCHLHTPLFISLLRGLIGWALGAAIGAVLFRIVDRAVPCRASECCDPECGA